MKSLKYRLAEWVSRAVLRLPDFVLARVVRHMAETGRGSDASLKWGALALPVHFYSPVPDLEDLERRRVWDRRSHMVGVDLRTDAQLALLNELGRGFGAECRWPAEDPGDGRFYTENGVFSFGCAASTHCMVRRFAPRRVIEIGSGNSSMILAAALDANRKDGRGAADYTIVDPYPGPVVQQGLPGVSRLIEERVETVDAALFDALSENDILFIDSGHTVRIGGDVNELFLEILPRLNPGVIVHVHDIALPYEYDRAYARGAGFRMFWTEAYLLQAFLCLNREFEVLLAMNFLQRDHTDVFRAAFPAFDPAKHRAVAASFWMRRVGGE